MDEEVEAVSTKPVGVKIPKWEKIKNGVEVTGIKNGVEVTGNRRPTVKVAIAKPRKVSKVT